VKGLVCFLSFLFLVCLPVAAQTQQTIRVNAGGPAYSDSKGHSWSADYGFNTGTLSNSAPKVTVSGTPDPTLFKSARVGTSSGADLQYQFAVSNGLYNVNLYFAETYFTAASQRVFDVQMQGTTVFAALDIFATAGLDHALVKSATVSVTNGQLIIRFAHRPYGNVPVVAALEILPGSSSSSLQFSTSSLPAGQVGASYSTMVQATGGTTPYHWSISSGTLPAGLTLAAGTGIITGTPTTSGSYTFTAKVTDSTSPTAQTATKSLTITVASAPAPVQITTTSLPSAQVAVPYSTALAAIDGVAPYKWTITSGVLPAGLTLASGGTVSGTPTTSGTFSFTAHVTDSSSSPTSASANLSIATSAASSHSVMLNWTASPSPGVTGYNVYRSTVSGSGYAKINSSVVSGLTYTDATVVNGVTYYYVTTSLNASGDESSYSEQVQMIVP
jgi:hypothetical protein